ncbi:MAG: hypothetical protein Q8K92_22710 [Leadbetterella sp.]|nr:hypothetical protein [Leadbetterella sp.]
MLFEQYEGTLFSSLSDVKRMIIGNYIVEEDFENRLLSKLSKDMLDEIVFFAIKIAKGILEYLRMLTSITNTHSILRGFLSRKLV